MLKSSKYITVNVKKPFDCSHAKQHEKVKWLTCNFSHFFFDLTLYPLHMHTHTHSGVDGQWSVWTPWGQCSVSCGAGLQSRYRFCSSPQRSGSSLPCLGPHREDQVCIIAPCDREFVLSRFGSTKICSSVFKCKNISYSSPRLSFPMHILIESHPDFLECWCSLAIRSGSSVS